jgi:hypothetical protein
MMKVSPPNREGYVSLGESQIMSKLSARRADLVLAESIRTRSGPAATTLSTYLRSITSWNRGKFRRG